MKKIITILAIALLPFVACKKCYKCPFGPDAYYIACPKDSNYNAVKNSTAAGCHEKLESTL
jgi:hypothetical protein